MIHQLRLILRPIIFINILLSIFMAACGIYGLLVSEYVAALAFFKTTAGAIILSGFMAMFSKSREKKIITIRTGFVLVVLIWVFTCVIGAVPYYLSHAMPNFVDALFESVSGFTTVGASILSDIERLPSSILLWRAITHWIGGGGIVVLSVAILPLLGIGGTHLMQAETTGVTKEKLTPRITQTAKYIWILYVTLNIIGIILLSYGGMNLLDAFTYSNYPFRMPKIVDKKTHVREKYLKDFDFLGVWVDLFSLDYVSVSNKDCIDKYMILEHRRWCALYKQSTIIGKLKLIGYNLIDKNTSLKDFKSTSAVYTNELHDLFRCTDYSSEIRCPASINDAKRLYNAKDFSSAVFLPFESLELPVPCGYQNVLQRTYGDYMKLPPLASRKIHKHIMKSFFTD